MTNRSTLRTALRSIALAATLAAAGSAFAQAAGPAATPGIDQRQAKQEQRIDQGVASGQLNKREEHRLERQQGRIDKAENAAKSDGVVTGKERAGLHAMQDNASKRIYRQKHDGQARKGTAPAKP